MKISKALFNAVSMVIAFSVFGSAWTEDWQLPVRKSPRLLTTNSVPHIQIDVEAIPELTTELLQRVATIPNVEIRKSVISLPGAKGFWLNEDTLLARPDVIVGGREFAHIHPDGSLHASLPEDVAESAIRSGWAIKHPWADKREGWSGFVMIYTSQSTEELEVVFQIILASYNFVTGRKITATSN